MFRIVIFGVFTCLMGSTQLFAQLELSKPFQLELDSGTLMPLTEEDGFAIQKSFDIDKDGTPDIQLMTKSGRGPLSTYYTSYRLRAINGFKFIKSALPLAAGDKIVMPDLFTSTTNIIQLCNVGGSLRFPEESYEKFSGGSWWGRENAIGLMCVRADVVQAGYSMLKVTKLGEVSFGKTKLQDLAFDPIPIEK